MKVGKEAQWARALATKADVLSSVPLIHRVEGENRWFQVVHWLPQLCPLPAPPINKQTKTNVQKFGEFMKPCELMPWRLWQFSCAHRRGLPGFHSTCLCHKPSNGCCFHQVCWEFTMQLELLELLRSITVFVSQPLGELVPDRFGQVCGQWGARERFL